VISEDDFQLDPVLGHFYGLSPESFTYVERFELRHTDEYGGYGHIAFVNIELSSSMTCETLRLHLTFSGVLNLRLIPRMGKAISFNPLKISSVRDLQWEGAYYEVKETEGETISFMCRDFTAELKQQ
jgi:hypothetical protein